MRNAVFAGQFYPAGADELRAQLNSFFKGSTQGNDAIAIVSPHAGYVYSGRVAACAFSALKEAGTYIILSPNHTGIGGDVSIYPAGEWETPLGKVEVDAEIAERIARGMGCECDEVAHAGEHSIEVQIPFLQFMHAKRGGKGGFKIVAITIADTRLETLKKLGKLLHNEIKKGGVALIASGDFTHHEPLEIAERKDKAAIAFVERMDTDGFYNEVTGKGLSICGMGPVCAVMNACEIAGIKRAELLKYDTSASAGGNSSSVVGYAAISFK